MPIRTWGCLNRACYPFEFDSSEEPFLKGIALAPAEDRGKQLECVPCPQCGGPTKWIPKRVNINRPMPEGRKSKSAHADEILKNAVEAYNSKVDLPGLRLAGATKRGPQGMPLVPGLSTASTKEFSFPDATGRTWNVPFPVNQGGQILPISPCLPVPGMEQKITFKPDTKRGNDQPPRVP
jgi:hypothetical protein